MKLYIPAIGDELRLTADWTFNLYDEGRNFSLLKFLNDPRADDTKDTWSGRLTAQPSTIPAGAILKVDRIYIRKGKNDFDSITFFWKGAKVPGYTEPREVNEYLNGRIVGTRTVVDKYPASPVRFWVKLEEANNIEFEKA